MIDDSDIQRSALAIQCAEIIIQLNSGIPENNTVLQKCVKFSGSTLIQGHNVINHLTSLFQQACKANIMSQQILEGLIGQTSLTSRSSGKMAAIIIVMNFNQMSNYV